MRTLGYIVIAALILGTGLFADTQQYEQKAMAALKEIATSQVAKIEITANSTNSTNERNLKGFVLSTQIQTFSDIPKSIDRDIKQLKEETRFLIRQIALDIELHKNNASGALGVDEQGNLTYKADPGLPADLNKKREALLESSAKMNVSVRSAYLALKLLADMNNEIIKQARAAKDRREKQKLYMKQAIYVYEMSDIVLELLNSLTLDGKNSIDELHQDAISKAKTNIEKANKLKEKVKDLQKKGLMSSEKAERELEGLDLQEKAIEKSLDAWKGILDKVESNEKLLEKLKKQRDLIEYKKEKAELQIATLRDIRGVAALKEEIGYIDDLVDTVDQLDLLVLDENTVTELLGGYEN
jgi:hypothetical protein